jgi:N12 class adenine-specific DNA methylase
MQRLYDGPNIDDFEPDDEESLSSASGIVGIIELVNRLQERRRRISKEEREKLASWMGWGPVSRAFESDASGKWAEMAARLRLLLGPKGFEAARASTPHSFFTDRYLADGLWQLATGLGFEGGNVLELGCGSGAVIAAAPSYLTLDFTGVEREPFSAAVAQARFPSANIICCALEDLALVDGFYDLVIGNIPFGNALIYDRLIGRALSLHNYFIWRALQALRPGGIAVLITSRYTLDAKKNNQRDPLRGLGNLLGAIRLPSGAHKAARTDVVTDILILQRFTPDVEWKGCAWAGTTELVVPGIAVNEYFRERPYSIVGTPMVSRGAYRNDDLVVKAPRDIQSTLSTVINRIVWEARDRGGFYIPPVDRTVVGENLVRRRSDGFKEGSFQIIEGQLFQIVDGEAKRVTRLVSELTALVRLRNAAVSLLDAERDFERDDESLIPLRRELNARYDAYVKIGGPIHRAKIIYGKVDPETGKQSTSRRFSPAVSAFKKDPDCAIVFGLEEYDDDTESAKKVPIFERRINIKPVRKTRAETSAEALALCLDEYGYLNFEAIARLLGINLDSVPRALGDLVYEHPETEEWQTASEYLSGNVREKLDKARRASSDEPLRFSRNVAALEAAIPEDLLPEEIRAILGAPWIAPSDIEQFCEEILEVRPVVSYEKRAGTWQVDTPSGGRASTAATSEWGTERIDAYELIEQGLNRDVPMVYDRDSSGNSVKNIDESLAAQDKLRGVQALFSEWVWEDEERASRLAAVYNRLYNSVAPRNYYGSHLTFPGMSREWQNNLYPWQRDFVWRMVCSPSALCGHPVGAGKTTTQIAAAMTLKRMGLASKVAIVVPNHLLEQITAEAQRLYPGASILMVSRDDLKKDRRKIFAARIAMGNYDLVVMTHSSFGAIKVHPETEKAYLDKRIAVYRQALLDVGPEDRKSIKRLEMAIEKMYQRQRELMSKERDDGVTFEQLGISCVFVDEAHLFKNLGLPTNIQSLRVEPSKRAVDLEMKLRWLEERYLGRPFGAFFTATPLSNSMVEAYVMAWYLAKDLLEESGLLNVDAFASVFIQFQTRVEVSPNGASFTLKTRPARFVNIPEFLTFFKEFADLRGPEILSAKRPEQRENTITIETTAEMQEFVDDLVNRSELIDKGSPRVIDGKLDNMLWVTAHGRMAALDLSLVGIREARSPKLEAVVAKMLKVFNRCQIEQASKSGEFKSLQIGFCDLGTPSDERGEQIYGKLKQLLIDNGIPAHGIRYIHEAKTDAAKARLFKDCRRGAVAILLGSTEKFGTGTNIQNRCAAIHHIDVTWRPDGIEQREGRAVRPGNSYAVVDIFRYVQQRTFDAFSWQTLTRKAVFYDQLRSGKLSSREFEVTGDLALSYAQVKAAATGDPLQLELAELDVAIAYLERLQSTYIRARRRDASDAALARSNEERAVSRAAALRKLASNVAASKKPGLLAGMRYLTERAAIGAAIVESVKALLFTSGGRLLVGSWAGENVVLEVNVQGKKYNVRVILGDDALIVEADNSWMAKKQHQRWAEAIEMEMATALDQASRQDGRALNARKRAEELERQAQQPFARAEELKARLRRKMALDEYTTLAAAARGDEEKQQEVAALREQLLKTVLNFDEQPGIITSSQRPRFGELAQMRKQRRKSRKTDDTNGTQLVLFPA